MVITHLILITGSRHWRDRAAIRCALASLLLEWGVAPQHVGFLHGGAGGADTIGVQEARKLGMYVVGVEPDWDTCAPNCPPGRHRRTRKDGTMYCPTAGHRRNQAMVDRVVRFLAGDPARRAVCLVARAEGISNGTDNCVKLAQAVKIPLVWVLREGACRV